MPIDETDIEQDQRDFLDYIKERKPKEIRNWRDENGWTYLHLAADANYPEVIDHLITKIGFDINVVDKEGKTALHIATKHGDIENVKFLLKMGAEYNIEDKNKKIPRLYTKDDELKKSFASAIFINAAREEDIGKVINNLERGADINWSDKYHLTALHYSSAKGNIEIVNHLLSQNNIDPNPQDIHGSTPLDLAVSNGHIDVVKSLLKKGAGANIQDQNGKTALHIAAAGLGKNQIMAEIMEELLVAGADINIMDEENKKAFDYIDSSLGINEISKSEIEEFKIRKETLGKLGFSYSENDPSLKDTILEESSRLSSGRVSPNTINSSLILEAPGTQGKESVLSNSNAKERRNSKTI